MLFKKIHTWKIYFINGLLTHLLQYCQFTLFLLGTFLVGRGCRLFLQSWCYSHFLFLVIFDSILLYWWFLLNTFSLYNWFFNMWLIVFFDNYIILLEMKVDINILKDSMGNIIDYFQTLHIRGLMTPLQLTLSLAVAWDKLHWKESTEVWITQ